MTFDDTERNTWTREEGLRLAKEVEAVAPQFGAHVALTGGLLYKEGERKDADLLFYRIRQTPTIDEAGLFKALADIGLVKTADHGFVKKADYRGKVVDLFFPEQCTPDPDPADERSYG